MLTKSLDWEQSEKAQVREMVAKLETAKLKDDAILKCSLIGDRNTLRAALELLDVAEQQGCKAIQIWRNNSPTCFYYLNTLRDYKRSRDTQDEFEYFLRTYDQPNHVRGRRCRGKKLDSILDKLSD